MTLLTRLATALLKTALIFFPKRYREEFGWEHACVFELALKNAARQGKLAFFLFFARECRDLPAALLREHAKGWNVAMNPLPGGSLAAEKPLNFRQKILFLSPFFVFVAFPLAEMSQISWLAVPAVGLLGLILIIALWGLAKKLPRWALPSLGLGLGVIKLFSMSLIFAVPGLMQLKTFLWTDFIPGRVLYALILSFLEMLPPMLLLVGLTGAAVLAARHTAMTGWRTRLEKDWTLLPFMLYVANLLAPTYEDPYRGLEPYELAFALVLVAGAWPYLRASRPQVRMAALMVATLLAGGVLAFGVYQLYPAQIWVQNALSNFPRWWETLIPLLNTLVLLLALGGLALFGARLNHNERDEAAAPITALRSD